MHCAQQGLEIVNGFASQPIADPFSQEPYTKGSDLLQREFGAFVLQRMYPG
jgi:hypothetical protein